MKISFEKDQIQQGMPGIVILSHATLAVALKETAQMVFSKVPNVAAFSLEYGDEVGEFAKAFQEAIESFESGAIVFVDLVGGTPCNQLLLYAKKNNLKLNIIAGVNLPMIITALSIRSCDELSVIELKNKVVDSMDDYVKDISSFC